MSWREVALYAAVGLVFVLVIYAADTVQLWAERKGWMVYRGKKPE